jgi:hypothetical protein
MREIRPSGSEGGAGQNPRSYLYPFASRLKSTISLSAFKCLSGAFGQPDRD